MKKFFLAVISVLSIFFFSLYYFFYLWRYSGPDQLFIIESGESFAKINYRLGEKNLIPSSSLFYHYAKHAQILNKLKAGNYLIENGMNFVTIISFLTTGSSIQSKVTIPEGSNIYDIAKILESAKITSSQQFITAAFDKDLLHQLAISADSVEGYLYPDTYFFEEETLPAKIITVMVHLFKVKTKSLDFSPLGMHATIILASVVEKETGASFERPIIAGVFLNRLQKNMRLQSDPTVIYGMLPNFDGNIRKKDLLTKTPYNTYRIKGLPHGPIANPGLLAIQAVLSPQVHDYLYFVSKNDGTHIFTKSYQEHWQAVQSFQKNRAARQGKSWRDLKE